MPPRPLICVQGKRRDLDERRDLLYEHLGVEKCVCVCVCVCVEGCVALTSL